MKRGPACGAKKKQRKKQGGLSFSLMTLSQTGREEEAGREGRKRKAVFAEV